MKNLIEELAKYPYLFKDSDAFEDVKQIIKETDSQLIEGMIEGMIE